MKFIEKLTAAWTAHNSLLCIGFDPQIDRLPLRLRKTKQPFFAFARDIIDRTHDLVCAYKFQIAHYAATGRETELCRSIGYLRKNYPHIPVILDAKRADIGTTAEQYATEVFARYRADAVTVNPYMGQEAVQPFLNYREKGVIVLCRTSNTGAGEFQDLLIDGKPLFAIIAQNVSKNWNTFGNCLLVVGGTSPNHLASLRKSLCDMPFLVPGLGFQGADLATMVKAGINSAGTGLVTSSSRQIIYASQNADFANAARQQAQQINIGINATRDAVRESSSKR